MKLGVIGTGDISHEFVKAAQQISELELVGVSQRSLEKAQVFANEYQLPFASDSLDALLEKSDIVYCGLPNSLHFETAKKVIENKVHIIIEKPVTSNTRELDTLMSLAKQYGVMIFEASRVTTLPHFKKIVELLEDETGEIFINISFCKQSRKYFAFLDGQNPNTFTTKYSGGALYDLGVYGVHFAVGLLGKPTNINFSAHKLSTGTDGFSSLILEYPRGLVTINISKMTHGDSSFTIQGLKKKISSNFSVSTIDTFDVIENKQTTNFNEQPEDNMVYFLRNMVNIIKNNDHVAYEKQLNDSYLVSEIMEKARQQVGIVFDND